MTQKQNDEEYDHPCAQEMLIYLLYRIGNWTTSRFDQWLRHEYGDEATDFFLGWLKREAGIRFDKTSHELEPWMRGY